MSEIYSEPNKDSSQKEWVSASQSDRLMIRELKFESNGTGTRQGQHELSDPSEALLRITSFICLY
jgi:hypothetical protein